MKWLVDTMGIDELRERILKERKFLPRVGDVAGRHPRAWSQQLGDAPAGARAPIAPTAIGQGTSRSTLRVTRPVRALGGRQRRARRRQAAPCRRIAYARLGDITADQFRALAADPARASALDVRVTNRQNFVFRDLTEAAAARAATTGSTTIGMAEPGAELARDVVACPGADTCNLAVTQSRGLADGDRRRARGGRPRRGRRRAHQHLRLHQLAAASTTSPTSASSALERRAHGRAAPGYQMLLGGYVGEMQIEFGEKALQAAGQDRARGRRCGSSAASPSERQAGETFRGWLDRVRRRQGASATTSTDLDEFPTPDEAPEFYVDYDETGPYVAEVGESECAT